ncbi:hypothetical protein MPTK1_5g11950 [Marchantia polymorpha subsp. ruderalis]|uniref:Uncharacterized protein n=2 Tax=Marchantia polymorpha TaxID=3197 RepID=A0AAF6BHG1_MARPO|nr:hypothetical protein MARPO_0143s0024 [Marchantia polymorpha]BBN11445.1 hypothetical protein Mp_5g11950 [Marchantia polymorpha subsp. ruderalis]|eukprot:PTQ29344.1 hypothetical protein MARPO_0143s0024 [Marchantia polymorpha]
MDGTLALQSTFSEQHSWKEATEQGSSDCTRSIAPPDSEGRLFQRIEKLVKRFYFEGRTNCTPGAVLYSRLWTIDLAARMDGARIRCGLRKRDRRSGSALPTSWRKVAFKVEICKVKTFLRHHDVCTKSLRHRTSERMSWYRIHGVM